MGLLVIGAAPTYLPFYTTILAERGMTHYKVDSAKIYRSLLTATLPYLAGETDTPPAPIDDLLETELIALAALQSWEKGDIEVSLDSLNDESLSYDGAVFAEGYRKAKYP